MRLHSLRSRLRKLEASPPAPDSIQPPDWLPKGEERTELYEELVEDYSRGKFHDHWTQVLVLLWNDKMVEDFVEDVLKRIEGFPPKKVEPIKRQLLAMVGD